MDSGGPEESADSTVDSSSTTTSGLPWEDEGFWTEPGPMEHRLLPSSVNIGDWAVRMATSVDGVNWEADPQVVAYGFSSLDLLVTEGGLLLAGVVSFIPNDSVLMEQPSVIVLNTSDLKHWGSHRFGIGDASRKWVVDPSLKWTENNGLQATWYGTDIEGDPAQLPGDHEVFTATWGESGFVQDSLLYSTEWLADPSLCTLNGERWLWYTYDSAELRVAREGAGGFSYLDQRYEQLNVPWCQDAGDHLEVWAQGGSGAGPPWKLTVTPDGKAEKSPVFSGNLFGQDNCTSPAVGYYQDRYVLFCAVLTIHP